MTNDQDDSPGDEVIGRLIAAAGPGQTARREARERIYKEVRARWEESLQAERERSRPRSTVRSWTYGLAAAAAAAAVTLFLLQDTPPLERGSGFAQVLRIEGVAEIVRDDANGAALPVTGESLIAVGDRLRTDADGRVAIALDDVLLRINVDSDILFAATDLIELGAGTLYLDTGQDTDGSGLEVQTRFGSVEHIGTQFEVRLDDAALRLRVREGAVLYTGMAGQTTGRAGEELLVGADGRTARSVIAPDDAAWSWASELASLPAADSYALGDVVDWIARENGLTAEYPSAVAPTRIFGISGLNPTDVLEIVRRTTSLSYEIRDRRLIVLDE